MIRDPDTLNALLDSVERFVRERLAPAEHDVQETDEIPEDIVAEMKELGLFGLTTPRSTAAWASRWRKRPWSLW
jgi:acyl-CoA dehydrogenase